MHLFWSLKRPEYWHLCSVIAWNPLTKSFHSKDMAIWTPSLKPSSNSSLTIATQNMLSKKLMINQSLSMNWKFDSQGERAMLGDSEYVLLEMGHRIHQLDTLANLPVLIKFLNSQNALSTCEIPIHGLWFFMRFMLSILCTNTGSATSPILAPIIISLIFKYL